MNRITVTVLPFILGCSLPAAAEHAAFKLFADAYEDQSEVRDVLNQDELSIVQASESMVPCEPDTPFGVLYVLQKGGADQTKLVERWHHPHVTIRDARHTDRDVDVKFGQAFSEPKFSGYELLPALRIDGEFRLEVLEDGAPIVSHTFKVDCEGSEAGDELICKDEKTVGTRVTELVCKTTEQINQTKEEARRNIRGSDGG